MRTNFRNKIFLLLPLLLLLPTGCKAKKTLPFYQLENGGSTVLTVEDVRYIEDTHVVCTTNLPGCWEFTGKTGDVIGMKAVNEDDEIMMINSEGIIIRMSCADISKLGRITSGVKLINLNEEEKVVSLAKVRKASAQIDGEEIEIEEDDDPGEEEIGEQS